MLRINTIFTEVCNGSARATQDDIVCGYIHPDDRVFAVLSGIQDLEYQLETLQIQLGFIVAFMFVISILFIISIFILVTSMYSKRNHPEQSGTKPTDENHENHLEPMVVKVSN